jgi:Xaa-Pro aminopeptidase
MDSEKLELELSLKERDRRWLRVREKMVQEGLAAALVYGNSVHIRGLPCHYLTNLPIFASDQDVLLLPVEGDPIFLISSPVHAFFGKQLSWVPAENVYQSTNLGADLARHLIALKLQKRRVGIDNPGAWPMQEYMSIKELCPDIELVDVTSELSKIRAQKSDEEIKLMEEAIRVGELAQKTFLANLKPGVREEEVISKVEEVVRANGVENRLWLLASTPDMPYPWLAGKKRIQKPNPVGFSSEFQRTAGYACQVIRTYCWEEPKGDYKRMWEVWEELRDLAPREFRPGRLITDVATKVEALVRKRGFDCNGLGHGLGLTYFETPGISSRPQERGGNYIEWTIMPNEVYAFHPMIRSKGGEGPLAWEGDMYFVGEDSTRWMTPFLPGLPEMIPA